MGPIVRAVREELDVRSETLKTTITGDAWQDGPAFELQDCGGAMSVTVDGAWWGGACG